MATFLIRIQLHLAAGEDYHILDACMKQENFTPVYLPGADEKEFSYYGNQHLLYINEVVQRAAMSTGKKFSFTVIKDERTEKQYHGQGVADKLLI